MQNPGTFSIKKAEEQIKSLIGNDLDFQRRLGQPIGLYNWYGYKRWLRLLYKKHNEEVLKYKINEASRQIEASLNRKKIDFEIKQSKQSESRYIHIYLPDSNYTIRLSGHVPYQRTSHFSFIIQYSDTIAEICNCVFQNLLSIGIKINATRTT